MICNYKSGPLYKHSRYINNKYKYICTRKLRLYIGGSNHNHDTDFYIYSKNPEICISVCNEKYEIFHSGPHSLIEFKEFDLYKRNKRIINEVLRKYF